METEIGRREGGEERGGENKRRYINIRTNTTVPCQVLFKVDNQSDKHHRPMSIVV